MTDTNIFQQIVKKIAPKLGENSQKTLDFLLPDIRQKYPTFWVPEPDFLKFLPGPTRIRLFTTRTIRHPTFWYPLHH